MKCLVCGNDGGPLELVNGEDIGPACAGHQGLVWDAHFTGKHGTDYEKALVRWDWRREVALAAGEAFTEPPPPSPAEADLSRAMFEKGWA